MSTWFALNSTAPPTPTTRLYTRRWRPRDFNARFAPVTAYSTFYQRRNIPPKHPKVAIRSGRPPTTRLLPPGSRGVLVGNITDEPGGAASLKPRLPKGV